MVNSCDDFSILKDFTFTKSRCELRSMIKMSSLFKSSNHYPTPTFSHQPYYHRPGASSFPTTPTMGSDTSSLLPVHQNNVRDHDLGVESDSRSTKSTTSNLEADKILRNSLYLTFNAPRVDEYHRGIFLTHPPLPTLPDPHYSGTLFHASYISPEPENPNVNPEWVLEERPVKDVSTAHSLVLLFRIGTLDITHDSIDSQLESIRNVIASVPLGRADRERELGPLKEGEGNPDLAGYDCIVWTRDTIAALADAKLIDLRGSSADSIISESRALAGPKDARTMVGVDFGGFRVIN